MAQDDRPYIRVHEGMPDHPKIEALSDRAFRLLVSTWCWCARQRTDGYVPLRTWQRRGTANARRELVNAGLIEQHADRVEVHDYLDWQRSAADIADAIEQKRLAGGLGNHVRWHVGAGKYDPTCRHCKRERTRTSSQPGSQPGSHPPWQPRSQVGSHLRSQNGRAPIAETETETETEGGSPSERDVPAEEREREAEPPSEPPSIVRPMTITRPAERCARHLDHVGDVPPCGACADARKAAAAFDTQQRERTRACPMCDVDGYRYEPGRRVPLTPYERCDHTTPTREARRA